jgi:hypothetical protein
MEYDERQVSRPTDTTRSNPHLLIGVKDFTEFIFELSSRWQYFSHNIWHEPDILLTGFKYVVSNGVIILILVC